MVRDLHSFKIQSKNEVLDYRLGEKLNLVPIKIFFQKKYNVKKLWNGNRHILGILNKNNTDYFLKLSTSKGISIVTKNEYKWNDYFNRYFPKNLTFSVPKNYESGVYKDKYFYLITDYFRGKLLCDVDGVYEDSNRLTEYIPQVIELAELIQKLPVVGFSNFQSGADNYQQKFIAKVKNWFNDILSDIRREFEVELLLGIIEKGIDKLGSRPRHGDFTPWHMIKLKDMRLGLIDGEHAQSDGVENYDICYFIQRVFSVLRNPIVAQNIYYRLLAKGYEKNKLKTVLAARAIGGFLDESLQNRPDYEYAESFKDWVINV